MLTQLLFWAKISVVALVQPSKALFPIVTMFAGILIAWIFEQPLNALAEIKVYFAFVLKIKLVAFEQFSNADSPIVSTVFGILIAVKAVLFLNALFPIVLHFVPLANVSVVSLVQPANALFPIVTTFAGMLIFSSDVLFSNEFALIVIKLLFVLNTIVLMLVQPLKAEAPIETIVLRTSRPSFPDKTWYSLVLAVSDIIRSGRLLQPANALSPIVVMLVELFFVGSANLKSDKPELFLNALFLMIVTGAYVAEP